MSTWSTDKAEIGLEDKINDKFSIIDSEHSTWRDLFWTFFSCQYIYILKLKAISIWVTSSRILWKLRNLRIVHQKYSSCFLMQFFLYNSCNSTRMWSFSSPLSRLLDQEDTWRKLHPSKLCFKKIEYVILNTSPCCYIIFLTFVTTAYINIESFLHVLNTKYKVW